jgi:hypothetical protein
MRLYIFRSEASTGLRALSSETWRAANCRISSAPGIRLEEFGPWISSPLFEGLRAARQRFAL